MDKNQLDHLHKSAENTRRIREMYNLNLPKIHEIQNFYGVQLPLIAEQMRESIKAIQFRVINLPKIDLSHFAQSVQSSISRIDFTEFNRRIAETAVNATLLANFYEGQIQGLSRVVSEISMAYASNIAKIRANAFLVTSALESIRSIPTLNYSFAAELAILLQRTMEASVEDESIVNEFENLVENKIKNQPNAKASMELIMFILTALSVLIGSGQFLYAKLQYEDGKQSSQANEQKYNQFLGILERISKNLEKITENPQENATFYVVNRTVELKTKPKFRCLTIAVLYPNQQIRLVKDSPAVQNPHKWVYVEYFDYLDGIPKYGWANKKYLIKIEKGK